MRSAGRRRRGLFFGEGSPAAEQADPVGGPAPERAVHLTAASPDRLDVDAGDPGESPVATVTEPGGLDGDVPAALLLVEAAQEQIDPGMEDLLGVMTACRQASYGHR